MILVRDDPWSVISSLGVIPSNQAHDQTWSVEW